jgi:hypothetical protein
MSSLECTVIEATGGGWADHQDAAWHFGRPARSRSAALEPDEAVEDEIECEFELGVVIAPAESAAVGDREGRLHDVGMAGAEFAGEAGGRLQLKVPGIVEESLGEPEKAWPAARSSWYLPSYPTGRGLWSSDRTAVVRRIPVQLDRLVSPEPDTHG